MKKPVCDVCGEPRKPKFHRVGDTWCLSCQRSYDQSRGRGGAVINVIEWAVKRVRKFERRRARAHARKMFEKLLALKAELERYKP